MNHRHYHGQFAIADDLLVVTIPQREIIDAMRMIWECMKIIVEPSSAIAFAAVLKDNDKFQNKKVGLIFSGGNVDIDDLPW